MIKFEQKIATYFANVKLSTAHLPAKHLIHLYADFIEVISLFSSTNIISKSDILDRFIDEGLINKGKPADEDQAECNDENEKFIDFIFEEIVARVSIFGSDYPFYILGNNKISLKDKEELDNRHKVYLSMLLSSNLNLFNLFQGELTKEFELISYYALRQFLPNHAVVKSFGENTAYTGNTIKKIQQLSSDLKINVDNSFLSKISPKNIKERGLDLIGWIPFDDSVSNFLSILCQCACGKDWNKKLIESRRYERYYKFYINKPIHAIFIPYSLINYQNSDFHQADEISIETLVFERKRILNHLDNLTFFDTFQSKIIVEKCLESEEDIV